MSKFRDPRNHAYNYAIDDAQKRAQQRSSAAFDKGSMLFDRGQFDEAREAFSEAINLTPEDIASWELYAHTLSGLGRHEESVEAFRSLEGLGHQCPVCAQTRLSDLIVLGLVDEAKAAAQGLVSLLEQAAKEWCEEAPDPQDLFLKETLAVHFGMGDWLSTGPDEDTDEQRRETLVLHLFMRQTVSVYLSMADWLCAQNRLEDADEAYRLAVARAERLLCDDRSEQNEHCRAMALLSSGIHHKYRGRIDAAEEAHRRAQQAWERLVQAHPAAWTFPTGRMFMDRLAASTNHLGLLYSGRGRLDRAETAYRRALAIRGELTNTAGLYHADHMLSDGAFVRAAVEQLPSGGGIRCYFESLEVPEGADKVICSGNLPGEVHDISIPAMPLSFFDPGLLSSIDPLLGR